MGKAVYHLRFQIVPGRNLAGDAEALAGFCLKHGIREAVLFVGGEEWNNGLLSAGEEDAWFEAAGGAKKILESRGLSVSLNFWMTALHCDRGRTFPPGRMFEPMVSPSGKKSMACASFADERWREYISSLFGRFAALGFRVMWVEDDFRYHNHDPLDWGGGFEEPMLERFRKKIGGNPARPEVVRNILRPGPPHPWRRAWLACWREAHLETARIIRDAVRDNAPGGCVVGLMSSSPFSHGIEGRDWRDLFAAFSIGGKTAHRPNFVSSYSEVPGKLRSSSVMRLDMGMKLSPEGCEITPEIENFPFSSWSKSDTSTWADMALAQFFGADAQLLDLFPQTGNRADEEPGIGRLLDRSRPALEWIAENFSDDLETSGIGVPWEAKASERVRTSCGKSVSELAVSTEPAWNFMLRYGIPAVWGKKETNVIFGKSAWIFSRREMLEMLSGGLLLDGEAAWILAERGLGRHAGVRRGAVLERESSKYSLETVSGAGSGLRKGFHLSVNLMERIRVFAPLRGAAVWTRIFSPENRPLGPGTILYENGLGGRTAVIAVDDPSGLNCNSHRGALLRSIVKFLFGGRVPFPVVSGGPFLMPVFFRRGREGIYVVFNGSPDPAEPLISTGGMRFPRSAVLLKPLENPGKAEMAVFRGKNGENVRKCLSSLPSSGFLAVKLKSAP